MNALCHLELGIWDLGVGIRKTKLYVESTNPSVALVFQIGVIFSPTLRTSRKINYPTIAIAVAKATASDTLSIQPLM